MSFFKKLFAGIEPSISNLNSEHSLVDMKELSLDLTLIQGKEIQVPNPLETEFDLADIYIGKATNRLDCSPFLHAWSKETERKYLTTKGIWLSATNESLFMKFGVGSEQPSSLNLDCALFFPVSENQQDNSETLCLVVTCMN